MSEERNNEYARALQGLEGMSVETLTQLGAHLSSMHPQELPIVEKSCLDYCKENSGAINVLGIAQCAHDGGFNDVSKLTNAVQTYVDQQRKILEGIDAQFKALQDENKMNATKQDAEKHIEKQDVEDSEQQNDLKRIFNSERNSHYVDLMAKNRVEDVPAIADCTIEELYFAAEKHRKLLESLEDKWRVERNKGSSSSSSSSKPKKKKKNKGK